MVSLVCSFLQFYEIRESKTNVTLIFQTGILASNRKHALAENPHMYLVTERVHPKPGFRVPGISRKMG